MKRPWRTGGCGSRPVGGRRGRSCRPPPPPAPWGADHAASQACSTASSTSGSTAPSTRRNVESPGTARPTPNRARKTAGTSSAQRAIEDRDRAPAAIAARASVSTVASAGRTPCGLRGSGSERRGPATTRCAPASQASLIGHRGRGRPMIRVRTTARQPPGLVNGFEHLPRSDRAPCPCRLYTLPGVLSPRHADNSTLNRPWPQGSVFMSNCDP